MSLLYHSWNSERIEIVMVCLFCVVCFGFSFSIDLGLVAILEVGSGLFVLMCSFVCRWTCRLCIEDLDLSTDPFGTEFFAWLCLLVGAQVDLRN